MKQADISKLGKYDIEGELGRGAMGVVYKGKDPFIERFVALKTVRTDMLKADDPEATTAQITRFKREAQAAGRINHPNIVGIYEYGEDGSTAFIAMEFVEGQDLKEFFDKNERFGLKDIVRIMGDTLSALDYAHRHGIVHRDIKPANIMLTTAGEVKITDFGIARLESSNLTQAGTVMGTPSYMSPEQFMGQQVDARSDIFSAGAVLYQLLTGEKPFTGSLTTIMHRVLHSQPENPSTLNVQIPRSFDQIVAKAMAKRPEDRYQTAAEFAQALRAGTNASANANAGAGTRELDAEATITDVGGLTPAARAVDEEAMPAHGLSEEAAPRRPLAATRPAAPPPEPPAKGGKGLLIGAVAGVAVIAGAIGGWLALGGGGEPAKPPQHEQPAPVAADDEAAHQQAAAEARRQAEEQVRADQAAAEARRQAEAQAAAETKRQAEVQAATEARRQAEAQATTEAKRQAEAQAAAETKRQAEAQARADQAAAEAKRQAEDQARQQAAAEAKRQAEEQAHRQVAALGSIRTALNRAPCAILKAEAAADGTVTVAGAIDETGSEAQLRSLIDAAAPGTAYALKTEAVNQIMCDPLAVVHRLRDRNQDLPQPLGIVSGNPGGLYKNGQNLILDVHGPSFPAYLQVDYFTLEGMVVHLLPNVKETDHHLAAGGQRRLGDPAAGGRFWTVGQPFGRELIVVIASAKPLFQGLRPEAENAAGYLTDLRKALDTAGKGATAPAAAAMFITTVPN